MGQGAGTDRAAVRAGFLRRLGGAAALAVVVLAASASPALSSVTIGQFVSAPQPCADNNDWAQVSVASGNQYMVPRDGTITSWSTIAGAGAGQTMTMKIWRPVFGSTYTLVGHDGPRTLSPSALNTFPASVPVKAGDILGLHSDGSVSACLSAMTPGDSLLDRGGDALDGESPTFAATLIRHLNIEALLRPANDFTIGAIARNKKKGTAVLTVNVPSAGELSGSANGAKVASAGTAVISKAVAAGPAQLLIKATGKKKAKLKKKGKVKLNVSVTFTPTDGDPSTQSVKVKLKKKKKMQR